MLKKSKEFLEEIYRRYEEGETSLRQLAEDYNINFNIQQDIISVRRNLD